jgi:preprotein translocase subunit SecG
MQVLFIVIFILHILLSLLLVVIVLIQQRTKGGVAGVFGGGGGTGAEQLFGSSGVAPFMTRITAILGAVFLLTSLLLVLFSAPGRSVRRTPTPAAQPQQTAPIPQPVEPAETEQEAPQQVPGQVILPDTSGGD